MNNVRAQGLNLSLGLPGGSGAGGGAPGSSSRPRVTPSLQLTPSPADALRSNAVRNSVRYCIILRLLKRLRVDLNF